MAQSSAGLFSGSSNSSGSDSTSDSDSDSPNFSLSNVPSDRYSQGEFRLSYLPESNRASQEIENGDDGLVGYNGMDEGTQNDEEPMNLDDRGGSDFEAEISRAGSPWEDVDMDEIGPGVYYDHESLHTTNPEEANQTSPYVIGTKPYTLKEFVKEGKGMYNTGQMDDFVRHTLCGLTPEEQQITLEPFLNRATPSTPIRASRDFDSLLGISESIEVQADLTIYPIPRNEDSLKSNIHLRYYFRNDRGIHKPWIHEIPNICLGLWGGRNIIRVLFLDLYSQDRKTHFVSPTEQREFYEMGLRPAIAELMGERSSEWPSTYKSELFRARSHGGKFQFGTKTLPEYAASQLGNSIRRHLSESNSACGFNIAFLHQIRGVKNTTIHPFDRDETTSTTALHEFLEKNNLPPLILDQPNWYIDVGIEVASSPGKSLLWRADSHHHIVTELLGTSQGESIRLTTAGGTKYYRDTTAHIVDAAGCRLTTGIRRGRNKIHYLQLYQCDKHLTAIRDGFHHGKYFTGKDITHDNYEVYVDNLYGLYTAAAETNDISGRGEVRLEAEHAPTALFDLSDSLIRSSLFVFDTSDVWDFRAMTVLAFTLVLSAQKSASPQLRTFKPALLLTGAAPWFLNSLHTTPDTGPSSRELMDAMFPAVDVDSSAYAPEFEAYGGASGEPSDYGDGPLDQGSFNPMEDDPNRGFILHADEHDRPIEQRVRQRGATSAVEGDDDEEEEEEALLDYGADNPPLEDETAEGDPDRPRASVERSLSGDSQWRSGRSFYRADLVRRSPNPNHTTFRPVNRERTSAPAHIYGLIFLREIRLGVKYPAPRFPAKTPDLSSAAYRYIFGQSYDELCAFIHSANLGAPRNKLRTHNRATRPLIETISRETIPESNTIAFEGANITLAPAARDEGSDYDSDDMDDITRLAEDEEEFWKDGAEVALNRIWTLFVREVTSLSPNRKAKSEPAYCRLSPHERTLVTTDTYTNRRLSDYFDTVQYQIATHSTWGVNFDSLFPKKDGKRLGSGQNFGLAQYYKMWIVFLDVRSGIDETPQESEKQSKNIRQARKVLESKYNTMFWAPRVHSDRMWHTKHDKHSTRLGITSGASPQILINPTGGEPDW